MIHCIGVGPGDVDYITQKGKKLIESADVVSGFQAVVDVVESIIPESSTEYILTYKNQTEELEKVAKEHHAGKKCVVLFMGDIHFSGFQLLERVDIACGERVESIPGISSAQIMASKGRVCFDETTFVTFHRRGDLGPFKSHLVASLKSDRNAIVIPLPWSFMPKDIAAYLVEEGVNPELQVEVWENLTRNEAEWTGSLKDCDKEFSDMSIMLIRTKNPFPSQI